MRYLFLEKNANILSCFEHSITVLKNVAIKITDIFCKTNARFPFNIDCHY